MDRDTRLGILASAILEGTPVDWPAADSTADVSDRGVVRQLQVLAEIAALNRRLQADDVVAEPLAAPTLRETPSTSSWGHLRLLEAIGRGAFGTVYRAWDSHLDREVALKLLRMRPAAGDPSASLSDPARTVHEGRLLARVRHPNVITVYGAETRDGTVGIWMELIKGRTLHDVIEQQGPLGAREAVGIGVDLCRALSAVHGAGLLHRDVTARNVMREDGGRLVLMDFGAGHETQGRVPVDALRKDMTGTPLYLAPELYVGGRADRRTDIYALGVLLFYLVTRRFPVTGRSLTELGEAHARRVRTRLRDLRADLPAPFVSTVERAIAADPASRFQTAGDLEAALEGTGSSRESPVVSRRAIALALTLGAIVIALIAGVAARLSNAGGGDRNGRLNGVPAALTSVAMRRLVPPKGVNRLSNPSDDGRFVAATTDSGDAAIVDLAAGSYRALGVGRLDANPEDWDASSTVLSPDGTTIAVNLWGGDRGILRLVRSDGTDLRTLADPGGDAIPYQWSRDGAMILASLVDPQGVNTIALVAAVDGAVRPLKRLAGWINERPELMSLSPDGRYIAYDYPEGATVLDRDIFILDSHTGDQWPLAVSPGHDTSPVWTPDGRAVVFFSDRNRTLSAWIVPMEHGRPRGAPQLVKDDVGRVWVRGFSRDGGLHMTVNTGFAELYLSALESKEAPVLLSPRQSLSNLYPRWSPDGRWLAYVSERGVGVRRELWLYDAESRGELRVPFAANVGTPLGWSTDSTRILVGGGDGHSYIVDRVTGQSRLIGNDVYGAKWIPEGVVIQRARDRSVVLLDESAGAVIRTVTFTNPIRSVFPMAIDGRSALAAFANGRVILRELRNGATREWLDSGVTFLGRHIMAPHTAAVAYLADRKDLMGQARTLMVWGGAGAPRELLRVRVAEPIVLHGWTADGLNVLVTRWSGEVDATGHSPIRTLWRVPITGGAPVSTGLAMEALRDISLHPDGRQVAFNARFKRSEYWVMENLIPDP